MITVKDLIEQLQKFDPTLPVICNDHHVADEPHPEVVTDVDLYSSKDGKLIPNKFELHSHLDKALAL